tara:strand:- start:766 stop:1497 length:732 start_codon:yes stop_codon:yes gene_type:complete
MKYIAKAAEASQGFHGAFEQSIKDPFRDMTVREMSLVQSARSGLRNFQSKLERLEGISKAAGQTVPAYERQFLAEEYQFITDQLEQVAKEAKFDNINLFDVSLENFNITLNKKLFTILGANPVAQRINLMAKEVFGVSLDGSDDSSDVFGLLANQKVSARNLESIQKTYEHLGAIDAALNILEGRLYNHFKSQLDGGKGSLLRVAEPALRTAEEISQEIFLAADSALSTQLTDIPEEVLTELI